MTERYSCAKKAFALTSFFFVAAGAYSRLLCEFYGVGNVNTFFISESNGDNIIQQLSLA